MKCSRLPLAALALLLACGCAREDRWNVLLVTIDTARADRLGCYGYAEPTSPNIDALAAEGALFQKAFCTNPITLPSHTSILTGTYPIFHGVRDNSTYVVREDVTTLAEVMKDAGYDTGAVVGAFVLDSRFNLDQGFTTYDDNLAEGWSRDELETRAANEFGFEERKANLVTRSALNWLRKSRSAPFFLWLHYFDPHQPVNPPEPYHSRFTEPYAGEIAFVDEQLGHVFAELKKQKLYDRTLIVIVADHGEGLMEHGEPTHSLLVFDSVMRVPLIFRLPGGPAGLRLEELSGTVDIMPTVLDLLGIEIPSDVQGRSLAPLVRGEQVASAPRALYMESLVGELQCGWGALRALRLGDEKIIHGPKPRYYRVGEDPGELYDLAAREPAAVERLTEELAETMRRWTSEDASASVAAADNETLQKLASLGYLASARRGVSRVSSALEDVQSLNDPHEMRYLFDQIGVATENLRMGYSTDGVRLLEQVLLADPDNAAALINLGKAQLQLKMDPRIAQQYFERCVAVDPEQEEAQFYLCRIKRAAGDLEGARRHAEAILEFQAHAVTALYELAWIMEALNDTAGAQDCLKRLLEIDETNVAGLLALGIIYGRHKQHEEAGPYFKRAVELDPESPKVLYNLGIWHLQGEDIDGAIATLSRAAAIDPNSPDVQFVLGRLLFERGENDRARETLLQARRVEASRPDRVAVIDSMLQSIGAPPGPTHL